VYCWANNIVRGISFQHFRPMWSWSTNVTDRETCNLVTRHSQSHLAYRVSNT